MDDSNPNYVSYRIPVSVDFEEIFSHFYFAENMGSISISKTLLPSFQNLLIFNFGSKLSFKLSDEDLEIEKCLVLGPIKKAINYTLPPSCQILVANFKDDAFYRFFGSASVAENLPINPDDLLEENCFTALWNRIVLIPDNESKVNYILEFCKPYIKCRNSIAEQLAGFSNHALNPIKSVAGNMKQSERHIQNNQKKHFGYSAKEVGRYQRFLKAIETIQVSASDSNKIEWFEIIDLCGYYDQSQLINDFKHYINLTPSKYLKLQQEICSARG